MNTIQAKINGMPVTVPAGTTILEAARSVQVKIPTLCKHEDLLPTAACGLCIVNIKGSPKKPRACSTPIENGMEITTHDEALTEIRRTVLELILSNHPNSCQTCGRNGSCELQTLAGDFGIRRDAIPRFVRDLPEDHSNGSIVLDFAKCIKCGRCIQVCQEVQNVWALSFLQRGINTRMAPAGDITLAESPCIKCGQCAAHCPTGAIVENDENHKVWEALKNPELHCTVQVAPSVRVALGEEFGLPQGTNLTGKIYTALRRLGFQAVFDTNFSADLTIMEEASEFVERFANGKGKLPLITSCSPGWIKFCEHYYPQFLPNLSTCKSPHEMEGAMIKSYYAQKAGLNPKDIVVVSVMPCTAKKYEAKRPELSGTGYPDVDAVITTRELARMIKEAGINFANLPDEDFDDLLGESSGASVIFGATGGVMEAALRTAYKIITGQELADVEFHAVRGVEGGPTDVILLSIRLPRAMLAAVVGASLGMAGAVYQGVFRNPLAGPYLLGTASGAALGTTLVMAAPASDESSTRRRLEPKV